MRVNVRALLKNCTETVLAHRQHSAAVVAAYSDISRCELVEVRADSDERSLNKLGGAFPRQILISGRSRDASSRPSGGNLN